MVEDTFRIGPSSVTSGLPLVDVNVKKKTNSVALVRERTIPTRPSDRRLSAKLVPTFADRGCCIVSTTDPYGRILGFLGRECRNIDTNVLAA
jgi:hypothetical protein